MALPNLYARRKRIASGTVDPYVYDDIPEKLRVQVIHVIFGAIGPINYNGYGPEKDSYGIVVEVMRKELGVFQLGSGGRNVEKELRAWILEEDDLDQLLSGLELSLRVIDGHVRDEQYKFSNRSISPDEAIAEFNARMQEGAVGYQYEGGQIVRVDSQVLHSEVVVPALTLLSDPAFASASEEYREAHGKFRSADYEGCLVDCCKAFESTLKIIGSQRGWEISPNDTASKLLAAAYKAEFIPTYMQNEFNGLKSILEGGIPTIRNKQGGHGKGSEQRTVSPELAAFQLHQTAAAIVFLVSHDKAK